MDQMYSLIPNRASGRVKGLFHAGHGTVNIDLGSNIFDDNREVEYHEYTHYHLSKFTNFGLVYMILQEILHTKANHMTVPAKDIAERIALFHEAMYVPQEGLAHLMQARIILRNGGIAAVKELESRIDNNQSVRNPKIALSYCRNFVELEQKDFDAFMAKASVLSLNTGIIHDSLSDQSLLEEHDKLKSYVAEHSNDPEHRFIQLCAAIEKDVSLLHLPDEEVAKIVGIPHWNKRTNLEQANLLNLTSKLFTDIPPTVKEEDIRTLSGTDVYLPAIEKLIFRDTNIERDAVVGVPHEEVLREIPYFRTMLMYTNTNLQICDGEIPFFSFSKNRLIINSSVPLEEPYLGLINNERVTKVIHTDLYDYSENTVVDRINDVKVNMVWYKTSQDLQLLLDMVKEQEIEGKLALLQLTDELKYCFYVIKLNSSDILHMFVGLPYHYRFISAAKTLVQVSGQENLWEEMLGGNEVHYNNFTHDLIGIPFALNLIEIFRDGDAFGDRLEHAIKNGQGVNDPCICGSGRKYKKCHGYK